jgi:hypothetical protein
MTATLSLTTIGINGIKQSLIEHWGLKLPGFGKYLKTWGRRERFLTLAMKEDQQIVSIMD